MFHMKMFVFKPWPKTFLRQIKGYVVMMNGTKCDMHYLEHGKSTLLKNFMEIKLVFLNFHMKYFGNEKMPLPPHARSNMPFGSSPTDRMP